MVGTTTARKIGFLGAGKMATALARGLISSGFARPEEILASDVVPAARESFAACTGAGVTAESLPIVQQCDVIILAVKPQSIPELLANLVDHWTPRHLLISIAAGTTLATLETATNDQCRVVRVMPNTPSLIGAGAAAFALGQSATPDDGNYVQQLLQTVGIAFAVPEKLLDAVTGLSGSGPAYVFQILEALSDGGVKMGLPRQTATQLAAQTLMGAARMVLETGEHPAVLRDAVTSPGGTTIAGLHALEQGGVRASLINAVEAATLRSQALGK